MADNDQFENDDVLLEEADDIDTDNADAKPKKRFSVKLLFIIAASVLVLVAVVALVLWFFVISKPKALPEKDMAGQKTAETRIQITEKEPEIEFKDIVHLEPFERIPLKGTTPMGRISLTLSLELVDEEDKDQIMTALPEFRTIVENLVSSYTWLELRGTDGKIRFKYALLNKLNERFDTVKIRNVYFTHFIMQ